MTRRRRTPALLAASGLTAVLVLAAGCGGGPARGTVIDDLSAGTSTTITFDPGFTQALTAAGVSVTAAGGATLAGGTATFPLTGGWLDLFDPSAVSPPVFGRLQHSGSGLTLTRDEVALTLGNFDVDPGRALVYADVVTNGEVTAYASPVFDLDLATLQKARREGDTVKLDGTGVQLTNTAANLLDDTFATTFDDATVVGTESSDVAVPPAG